MTVILLVRHGETDWLGERLAGRLPDIHLNAAGRGKAEQLANMLGPLPLAAVLSSPLERAMETADPTSRSAGKKIIPDDRLQEVDFGELSGKPFSELRELAIWKDVHQRPAEVRYPGGESLQDVQDRAVRAVEAIYASWEDGIVAAFTHADTIRLALAHFLRMPLAAYHALVADPGSVSVISFNRKMVRVVGINYPPGSPLQVETK